MKYYQRTEDIITLLPLGHYYFALTVEFYRRKIRSRPRRTVLQMQNNVCTSD